MKVIFYGNRQGNLFDKLIRWWCSPLKKMFNGEWKDSYSHVEILFSDGYMFSASQHEGRTRYKRHNPMSTAWVYMDLHVTKKQETEVRKSCDARVGAQYDYLGVLGFITPLNHDVNKYFCSEVCTVAIQEILELNLKASKTSPNALYKELILMNSRN